MATLGKHTPERQDEAQMDLSERIDTILNWTVAYKKTKKKKKNKQKKNNNNNHDNNINNRHKKKNNNKKRLINWLL